MNHKIILIEDEAAIRGFLKINFSRNNFVVLEAGSGEDGIKLARAESPDIALIDVMLPGIDGYEVCSVLRNEFPNMGIIMLTAKGQDIDRINGLEKGSDDYVVKPFNPTELILRVKALLRRLDGKAKADNHIIESSPFKIDIYSKRVFKNNDELDLTPTEYSLMKVFIENKGRAFTRDELLNEVWGYNYVGDTKIVDVNIRRLRSKIEDNSSVPKYIETVWGTGYRWNNE